MTQQTKAQRLADALETLQSSLELDAADELRRLSAINAQLLEALDDMCAEFRALDLPYGSKAYHKAHAAIAAAKGQDAQT